MTTIAITIASWIAVEIRKARLRSSSRTSRRAVRKTARRFAHRPSGGRAARAVAADHVAEELGQGRHLGPEADHGPGRAGGVEQRLGIGPGSSS